MFEIGFGAGKRGGSISLDGKGRPDVVLPRVRVDTGVNSNSDRTFTTRTDSNCRVHTGVTRELSLKIHSLVLSPKCFIRVPLPSQVRAIVAAIHTFTSPVITGLSPNVLSVLISLLRARHGQEDSF